MKKTHDRKRVHVCQAAGGTVCRLCNKAAGGLCGVVETATGLVLERRCAPIKASLPYLQ
jgi:hypothetical protein